MIQLLLAAIMEYPTPVFDFEPSVYIWKESGFSVVRLGRVDKFGFVMNGIFSHGGNATFKPDLTTSHKERDSLVSAIRFLTKVTWEFLIHFSLSRRSLFLAK